MTCERQQAGWGGYCTLLLIRQQPGDTRLDAPPAQKSISVVFGNMRSRQFGIDLEPPKPWFSLPDNSEGSWQTLN